MALYWPFLIADYYAFLEGSASVLAFLILISSVDDLFVDAWFWTVAAGRRLFRRYRQELPTAEGLRQEPEKPIAIMVPAWREEAVIAAMVENLVASVDYREYVVFVGTYVNDPATIAEVERVRRRYRNVKRVEVPHAGPTCKSDCLNWIIQAIFLHESQTGTEFAGVLLHDAEDVLHPLELRLINHHLPRNDLIQLPVLSLERHWDELVAGTYMDEFAEWHNKDLPARELMWGVVLSAGVGTCFSRRALLALSELNSNQPFNTDSLTEDYDVSLRLGRMGMRSIFARLHVPVTVRRQTWFGFGPERTITRTGLLSVQEYFPDTFRAAYRQKARWAVGLGFQAWAQLGWSGSLVTRYFLFRDRKGIVTALLTIAAYLLVVQFIAFQVAGVMGWWTLRFPPLGSDGWLHWLLMANGAAFILRAAQRAFFVTRIYGWEHGLLSMPRMIVSNFVNFMAVARAWKLFVSSTIFGNRIVWDKTMHDFPSKETLAGLRQDLGEILLSWKAIDERELAQARGDHVASGGALEAIFLRHGVDEEILAEAIAFRSDLPRARLTEADIRAGAGDLPAELRGRLRILAIGRDASNRPMIATATPLAEAAVAEIAAHFGEEPVQLIGRGSRIDAALSELSAPECADPASRDVTFVGKDNIEVEKHLALTPSRAYEGIGGGQ